MKELIKKIAELSGKILSLILPQSLGEQLRAIHTHIYTGYVKGRFARWGKGSVIAYRAMNLKSASHISVGCNVQISKGAQLTAWPSDTSKDIMIEIGDNCMLREGCHVTAANKITIGKNLLTGTNVLITDNSHGTSSREQLETSPLLRQIHSKGEVSIGDNVWLGNNVCVMPSVTIGDGAIIGANSVVTQDIPAYAIAAGVPARVVRQQ